MISNRDRSMDVIQAVEGDRRKTAKGDLVTLGLNAGVMALVGVADISQSLDWTKFVSSGEALIIMNTLNILVKIGRMWLVKRGIAKATE